MSSHPAPVHDEPAYAGWPSHGGRPRADALQRLSAALARTLARDEVAEVIVSHLVPAHGAYAGAVLDLSADGTEFALLAAFGLDEPLRQRFARIPVDAPMPLRELVATRTPVFLERRAQWEDHYPTRPLQLPPGADDAAWAALPLLVDDVLIGAITVSFPAPRTFGGDDRAFLRAFADLCAQAMDRARLFDAERRARETAERLSTRLRVLADAGRALSAELDVQATLEAIAAVAVPAFADGCTLDLIRDDGTLTRAVHVHRDAAKAALLAESAQRNPTVSRRTTPEDVARLMSGRGILVPELQAEALARLVPDAAQRDAITRVGLRSYMLAPLVVGGRTAGALSFMITESARRYEEDDLALAEELARRGAVALTNARLFEAERVARTEAEAANRAKMEFLTTMSHELRTPLNAIAGYAELIEMGIHGPVTDGQREALGRIRASQTHLLGLINDVLNFAKLDAGKVEFRLAEVPVRGVVAPVGALVAPQFDAKAIRYAFEESDERLVTRADADKLRQILLNLLSNAAKYTPRGGAVRVRCAADGPRVLITVTDTGIGIPAERLGQIFEPFVQLGRSMTSGQGGVGLGLAISRDLARGMGGDLTVDSALGVGSTFTLVLPRA
jgi:signal transduction histidine kinase